MHEIAPHGHEIATTRGYEIARPVTVSPIEQLAVAWLLTVAPSSRRVYGRTLRDWLDWCELGGVDPLAARRAHVDAWADQLTRAGRAPATVKRMVSTLSSFYAYATDEGLLPANPAARARRPRVSPDVTDTQAPDLGEAREMLRWAAHAGPRALVITHLALTVGLRAGEIASARVEDLGTDRGHRVLTVTRKGGRRQRVPLPPAAWHAIETYLAGRTTGPLVATRAGRPVATSTIYRTVRRVAALAGVPKHITPHSLRHACATLALDAGAELRDVQDLLGHADPRTTRRYDRARNRLDRSPAYAVAAALAG